MAEHHADQDDYVAVYPVIGLGQIEIAGISQFVGADRRRVVALVVERPVTVDLDEFVIEDSIHGVGVVVTDRCSADLLQLSHRGERHPLPIAF